MRRTGKNTGTETRESVFAGKHQWWGKEPMPEVFLHVCCFDILFWLWRTSIPSYTRGILVVRPFWSIAPVADPRSPPHPLGKCILSWKERGEKSEEEERERERRWGGGVAEEEVSPPKRAGCVHPWLLPTSAQDASSPTELLAARQPWACYTIGRSLVTQPWTHNISRPCAALRA